MLPVKGHDYSTGMPAICCTCAFQGKVKKPGGTLIGCLARHAGASPAVWAEIEETGTCKRWLVREGGKR